MTDRWLLVVVLSGCASTAGPSVRDPQGRPLPTTALLDADVAPTELRCDDGRQYYVVEAPHPYVAGARIGTARVVITDARDLCARIRAEGE